MDRNQRRRHNAEMRRLPAVLTKVPESEWPEGHADIKRFAVWRSRNYLVQLFEEPDDMIRMSVCRVTIKTGTRWNDQIAWDELQHIKALIGYGDRWAAEVYPPALHVVNIANMRHLWILTEEPAFGWRNA